MSILEPLAFSHISIKVADLVRSLRYYERVFGYRLAYDNQAAGEAERVLIGIIADTAVELVAPPRGSEAQTLQDHPENLNSIGFSCVTFSVPDVDAAYEALRAEGLANVNPPITIANGIRQVFLRDPDGNLLELIDFKGPKTLAELVLIRSREAQGPSLTQEDRKPL
jgi:catechol 2,3-dioxygenase-like lactoylglutathione lyase family enzyme